MYYDDPYSQRTQWGVQPYTNFASGSTSKNDPGMYAYTGQATFDPTPRYLKDPNNQVNFWDTLNPEERQAFEAMGAWNKLQREGGDYTAFRQKYGNYDGSQVQTVFRKMNDKWDYGQRLGDSTNLDGIIRRTMTKMDQQLGKFGAQQGIKQENPVLRNMIGAYEGFENRVDRQQNMTMKPAGSNLENLLSQWDAFAGESLMSPEERAKVRASDQIYDWVAASRDGRPAPIGGLATSPGQWQNEYQGASASDASDSMGMKSSALDNLRMASMMPQGAPAEVPQAEVVDQQALADAKYGRIPKNPTQPPNAQTPNIEDLIKQYNLPPHIQQALRNDPNLQIKYNPGASQKGIHINLPGVEDYSQSPYFSSARAPSLPQSSTDYYDSRGVKQYGDPTKEYKPPTLAEGAVPEDYTGPGLVPYSQLGYETQDQGVPKEFSDPWIADGVDELNKPSWTNLDEALRKSGIKGDRASFRMPDGSLSYTDTKGISWQNTKRGPIDGTTGESTYSPEENARAASGMYNQTANIREGERILNNASRSPAYDPMSPEGQEMRLRYGNKGTSLPADKANAVREMTYARNKGAAIEGNRFNTRLDGDMEAGYRQWAEQQGINPKDPKAEIDWRGYYQSKQTGRNEPLVKFLTPYHKEFSNQSMYAKQAAADSTKQAFAGALVPQGMMAPAPKTGVSFKPLGPGENVASGNDKFGGTNRWDAIGTDMPERKRIDDRSKAAKWTRTPQITTVDVKKMAENMDIQALFEATLQDNKHKDKLMEALQKLYGVPEGRQATQPAMR